MSHFAPRETNVSGICTVPSVEEASDMHPLQHHVCTIYTRTGKITKSFGPLRFPARTLQDSGTILLLLIHIPWSGQSL